MSYEDGVQPVPVQDGHTAAIDPGEIHTIAAVCTNGQALVISGRKMRSIHRLRNKKVKELQILMSRCKKGSRKWRQYNRSKKYILARSERQLGDVLHKTTRAFVDWCVEQGVGHVAYIYFYKHYNINVVNSCYRILLIFFLNEVS
ncbi:transposase [Bacillus songklensis]|uniref:Transposase n=1 Tax=Bacillus songklensis TaxID=1069116 RepID=A0ABV8B6J7_9BACI